ncbi:hypothetical protein CPB97_008131 [Podila verticillata]|nr:hypothetical protein CPB97_008131 [Podila verticillata]
MPTISVFDIHLLLDTICRDLTTQDVRRCLLVCRDWHASFEPYLWRTIVIRRRSSYKQFNSSSLIQARLAQRSKTIHSLESVFPEVWPVFLTVPLDNLTVLKSPSLPQRQAHSLVNERYGPQLMHLIAVCPKLEVLHVGFLNSTNGENNLLLPAIRRLRHLRELHIENYDRINCQHVRQWLLSSCRLEKLHIRLPIGGYHRAKKPEEDAADILELNGSQIESASITDLSFACRVYDCADYTFLPFLRLCSKLERFAMPNMYSFYAVSNVATILASTATRLRHLDLRTTDIHASNAAVLIRACHGLETFIGSRHRRQAQLVVSALLEHRDTLRVLDFEKTHTGNMTGAMLQSLLCACPNLDTFSALSARVEGKIEALMDPVVRGPDLEPPGGQGMLWACDRLRVLRLQFESQVGVFQDQRPLDGKIHFFREEVGCVGHLIEVVPTALIAQLGRLAHLEELHLGRATDSFFDPKVLQRPSAHIDKEALDRENQRQLEMHRENVSQLLRALSILKNLKRLELRGLKKFIDKDELKEARTHWKQIEWVSYS